MSQKKTELISIREAATILECSVQTINSRCRRGILEYEEKKSPGRAGKTRMLYLSSVKKMAAEQGIYNQGQRKTVAKEINGNGSNGNGSNKPVENYSERPKREILVGTDKSVWGEEAKRLKTVEDFLKRQRENLIEEGRLVYRDEIQEVLNSAIHAHYSCFLKDFRELIDTWGLRHNLSPKAVKTMQNEYIRALNDAWQRIKSELYDYCNRNEQ